MNLCFRYDSNYRIRNKFSEENQSFSFYGHLDLHEGQVDDFREVRESQIPIQFKSKGKDT